MTSEKTMNTKRFEEMVAAYGADFDRWPTAEREAALDVLGRSAAARGQLEAASELDAMLDLLPPPTVSSHLATRVLAAAPSAPEVVQDRGEKVIPLRFRRNLARYLVAPLAAAAMAMLWLALSPEPPPDQPNVQVSKDAEDPLLYAFADPDDLTDQLETQEILPEDYLALASTFEVPIDDL